MLDKTLITNWTDHPETYFCDIFNNWKVKKMDIYVNIGLEWSR